MQVEKLYYELRISVSESPRTSLEWTEESERGIHAPLCISCCIVLSQTRKFPSHQNENHFFYFNDWGLTTLHTCTADWA